ncbi:hypothetical protein LAZ67_2000673 [Cordylochernes scorpioides]|uniref:Uncharacterized protein n=1 Tax=Cordylochernes scorpioides TaxID=51811 RepID=A0ABY6K1L6_9ARAC|nr:hypothetical protein LAZ67_2000673 [Cordylochernes scorpioides]
MPPRNRLANQAEIDKERSKLLYPIRREDFLEEITRSKAYHDVPLGFRLPFYGFAFTYIWIQRDGYITFNRGLRNYRWPVKFPTPSLDSSREVDPSLIAPWFSSQDIPEDVPDAGVYLRKVDMDKDDDHVLVERLKQDFREGMIGVNVSFGPFPVFVPRHVLIVTWKNMTFTNARREERALKVGHSISFSDHTSVILAVLHYHYIPTTTTLLLQTNTYQLILATDEIRTYAMFNYDWIKWITHFDNFEGMNGHPAFYVITWTIKLTRCLQVGFNAGNRTRAYEVHPFSQHQRLTKLPDYGFGNGLNGRYYFQIDEEIWTGACIERELKFNWPDRIPITFFPRWGSMLGGTKVDLVGPCLPPGTHIKCKFDIFDVDGVRRDWNTATCVSPPTIFHGYVDLSVSLDGKGYFFVGKFYVQMNYKHVILHMARKDVHQKGVLPEPPDIVKEDLLVENDRFNQESPDSLRLAWNPELLSTRRDAPLELHLWGYREDTEKFPKLTYIEKLEEIPDNSGTYELRTENFQHRKNSATKDLTFGYISLNISSGFMDNEVTRMSPVVWSKTMPLAWYFRKQWEREHGVDKWRESFCNDWYLQEKYSDRFAITLFRCPCTLTQANLDRGRFTPDPSCNVIDKNCETFHREAHHCIRTGRPAVGGAGQQCCYDNQGELVRTGDSAFSGHPARSFNFGKHPYRWRYMVPTLSYWLHDKAPFYFCCKWAPGEENSESCYKYRYWRTSQDCSSYQPPGLGSVYGDPHLITYNHQPVTFNGKGEYVLTKVQDDYYNLDIQGRFEQVEPLHRFDPLVNGTRLTAIAAKDNESAIVEFRIRPLASSWRFQIFTIVDKEYVYFWDESMRVQNFKGVTIYQPVGTYNMSHVVAMFDSGAGIEVFASKGHMSAHVYMPLAMKGKTFGLLGNWTGIEDDNVFVAPDGSEYYYSTSENFFNQFGIKWRLRETPTYKVGTSLFFHDSVPLSQMEDPNFKPYFMNDKVKLENMELPPNLTFTKKDIGAICQDSKPCQYDYITTRDYNFAIQTKNFETKASNLARIINEKVIRCPELLRPRNGRKSSKDYHQNSVVIFSCDKGYRLEGYQNRKCHDTGLWSWGIEARCITEGEYYRKLAGNIFGIIIPIVLLVVIIIIFLIFRRRQRRDHYTGEKGM